MMKLLIQHLILANNHHYKLSINPRKVDVVLLERKDLKRGGFIHYLNCQKKFDHEENVKKRPSQTEDT